MNGTPTVRWDNWLKPDLQYFNPACCAPKWKWFWQLAVLADPIWGTGAVSNAGNWDYAGCVGPNTVDTTHTYTIGPRGRRRKWSGPSGNSDYCYFDNGGTGSTTARPAYFQPDDASVFAVLELVSANTGDHILAWEGDDADDGTANANTCLNLSMSASNGITEFHESGTGTNNSVVSSNSIWTANTRLSLAVVRTKATKTVEYWKDGLSFSSNTYVADCVLGNKLSIDIGDRNSVNGGMNAAIECMYLFKAALSPAMIQELHRDPWGPFRVARGTSSSGAGANGVAVRSVVAGMVG